MTNLEKIKSGFKTYPDFPQKGILFYDMMPLFADSSLFKTTLDELENNFLINKKIDCIIAPEARGFMLAIPLAMRLNLPFVPFRKKNKLAGELVGETFDLEYGTASLWVQKSALRNFKKFLIIDDVVATGGTIEAMVNIVKKNSAAKISQIMTLITLSKLAGEKRLQNIAKYTSLFSF